METIKASSKKAKPQRAVSAETETINFKVTGEFKRRFKGYAVSEGMSMVDLLKEGFELVKKKRGSGSASI